MFAQSREKVDVALELENLLCWFMVELSEEEAMAFGERVRDSSVTNIVRSISRILSPMTPRYFIGRKKDRVVEIHFPKTVHLSLVSLAKKFDNLGKLAECHVQWLDEEHNWVARFSIGMFLILPTRSPKEE